VKNLTQFRSWAMGDPVEIKVRGHNLSLRKHEVEQILVSASKP
jgi:Fe2+ transport system protein FeoA